MLSWRLFLVAVLCILSWSHARELLVVTASQDIDSLSRTQVKQVYMESGAGLNVQPVHLTVGQQLRVVFNTRIIGLTEPRIAAYWAQMEFTGRGTPPIERQSLNAMVEYLLENPGTIGYITDSIPVPDGLKVVYRVGY